MKKNARVAMGITGLIGVGSIIGFVVYKKMNPPMPEGMEEKLHRYLREKATCQDRGDYCRKMKIHKAEFIKLYEMTPEKAQEKYNYYPEITPIGGWR